MPTLQPCAVPAALLVLSSVNMSALEWQVETWNGSATLIQLLLLNVLTFI